MVRAGCNRKYGRGRIMNTATMWRTVRPAGGVSLILGGLALTALAVDMTAIGPGAGPGHDRDVTGGVASQALALAAAGGHAAADVPLFVETRADGTQSLRVILPDGRTATVVADDLSQATLLPEERPETDRR